MISVNSKIYIFGIILLILSGCISVPQTEEVVLPQARGIYHTVRPGETLWRISRTYNMDLRELVNVNNIADATSIEVGQKIFIPEIYKVSALDTKTSLEDFIWPLKGRVIVKFRQVYQNMINKGINIQYGVEQRDVSASRSGRVVFYQDDFCGFGKTVILEHQDDFITVYSGFQDFLVRVGDWISRGMVIARMGYPDQKGESFLHFEIRKGALPQNPIFYLQS